MDCFCEKCSLTIDVRAELFTVCEGRCAKSFHAECVGLTESDVCALSCNIIWMCNPCMKEYCQKRGKSFVNTATNTNAAADEPKSMTDEINELKTTVANIACTLSKLVEKPELTATHLCSTPISPLKLFDGTNGTHCSSTTQNESFEVSTDSPDSDVFSLYLTNIDKCATINDIGLMVSRQLGVPLSKCLDVVSLMPKWKNVSTIDYASFKVVLERSLKPIAMTASTWPKGVKFREFINRRNTWSPMEQIIHVN